MSDTRPDVNEGPIERSVRPESNPVVNFELSGGVGGFLFDVLDCAPATPDTASRKIAARVRI